MVFVNLSHYMADTYQSNKAKLRINKQPIFRLSPGPIEIVYGDKKRSEEIYRTVFDNTGTAMNITEEDTTISLANLEFEKLSGYSKNQLEGKKKWTEFFVEEDVKFMIEYHKIRRLFPDAAPRSYEARFKDRKGVIKNVNLTVAMIPGTKRSIISILDITKQKETERSLENRLKEFNVLYRVNSHIRIIHRLSLVLRNIAHDIAHAFEFSDIVHSEIVFDGRRYGMKKKELVYKIEEPIFMHGIKRGVVRVGYTKKLSQMGKSPFWPEEIKIIKTVSAIIVRHIIARESVMRYQKVVKKSIAGIYILEKDIIRYANDRFSKIFKCGKDKIVGRKITDFILDCPFYKKVAANPKSTFMRSIVKGRKKDGELIDLEVVYQKMDYHGRPAAMGHVHDITKLKEAERKMQNFNNELKQLVEEKTHHLELANKRLQSLNELKDEFIAVASHELRSPLTSVRGYLSFLMEKESLETLPESARQYLTKAYNNVESLNYLVNNILDVSRLDTGRFELQKVKTDLLQLAKDVLESLSFQANERKIKITFKGPSNIKNLFLKIDPIRISQVFRNLIDNSIKYSKKDTGISFEISRELGWAVIKISDQGVGIPQDMVDKVFEKFTQLKNPNTGQRGGAGLGLFIVKRIIQLHDGIIKVESNYGQGSVFTILLPMMGEYKEAK
jgi:PAS domain S-box-containing protein